jgi:cytochrome d ubiquinol oxidase subunit II
VIEADIVAVALWVGATAYALLGGADFGAGVWDLLAGRSKEGARPRALADAAITPVWEANHVWLIFCLVVLWTGFPKAFGPIMETLFIPLSLAALGIVLRGASFAFRKPVERTKMRRVLGGIFALSSVITPFFMGTAVGAIASGRVPADGSGDLWSSWTGITSILIGILFVCTCAFLAAVYLVHDARRLDPELERYFQVRASIAGVVTGVLAVVGLFVLRADARYVFDGLVSEALPLVIVSGLCGVATCALLWRGIVRGTRVLAAGAVTAVLWAWAVAQLPYMLPETLTVQEAAGSSATMITLIIVVVIAVFTVAPALTLLFVISQRSLVGHEAGARAADAMLGRED